MNSGNSKKLIFSLFLFISGIQSGKSAEFKKIPNVENVENNQFIWSKIESNQSPPNTSKLLFDNYPKQHPYKKKVSKEISEQLSSVNNEKINELVIQSDKQSEKNNVIYAEGNVSVSFKGRLLKGDSLIFDKSVQKLSVNGNIVLIFGNQIFKASKLEYNLKSEKGYLSEVKGYLNTGTFIDDLLSNFAFSDISKIEGFLDLKENKVLNTPGKVENWIFFADKITLDEKNGKVKRLYLVMIYLT